MRINKYLASCGLGSRRKVEELVSSGRVFVNGQKISNLSTDIKPSDKVLFDSTLVMPNKFVYYLLNKPIGYTSTTEDPHSTKNVTDLVPSDPVVFPVGRLDKDSEGLIMLTNDGDFAQQLSHPRYDHEKEYIVEAQGPRDDLNTHLDKAVRLFRCGFNIHGYKTRPAMAKVISKKGNIITFNIVLKEGRKRQIRITLDRAGFTVVSLKRIRVSNWVLGDLQTGDYAEFKP